MDKFVPGTMPEHYTDPDWILAQGGATNRAQARAVAAEHAKELVFLNDTYQVNLRRVVWPQVGPMVHLSIKRLDKEPIHDWRELQAIKSELVGAENEGIEIYPAESRVVDEANQFHLFVFLNPEIRIPVAFNQGRCVSSPEEAAKFGAKQRRFK